jgi:hypothetical protein
MRFVRRLPEHVRGFPCSGLGFFIGALRTLSREVETLPEFHQLVETVHEHEPSAVPGWLMFGVCGFAGSATPQQAPELTARLTCWVAIRTAGLTSEGLGVLLTSATEGLRHAHALAGIRAAAFAETDAAELTEAECLDALRPQLIEVLMEAAASKHAPGQDLNDIKARLEDLVEGAYTLARVDH